MADGSWTVCNFLFNKYCFFFLVSYSPLWKESNCHLKSAVLDLNSLTNKNLIIPYLSLNVNQINMTVSLINSISCHGSTRKKTCRQQNHWLHREGMHLGGSFLFCFFGETLDASFLPHAFLCMYEIYSNHLYENPLYPNVDLIIFVTRKCRGL